MTTSISRRHFLGFGLGAGALVIPACSQARPSRMPADAKLPPTPHIPDEDLPGAFPIKADICEPTADNIEGPFYKAGAPSRARFVAKDAPGEHLLLSGRVRGSDCQPLANATLDIWHADHRGDYDNDGWGLRGTLVTDAAGAFQLATIIPGRYLNGKRFRPSHIHVKVRAKGVAELTTQLYFAGDPYIKGDPFVVPSLIMNHAPAGSRRLASFDFVV